MICTTCKKQNRDIAKYCKFCGTALSSEAVFSAGKAISQETPSDILGGLVGLDHIRNELAGIVNVISRMKEDGTFVRMNYSMVLVGNSGTAKSLIGDLFYRALKKLEVVTKEKPFSIDAGEFIGYDNEAVGQLFKNAAGSMIIIDNAQSLIVSGEAESPLKRMLVEMDRSANDPIVILAGLPQGLREFLYNDENSNFTGRFRKIFYIDDYDSEILKSIIKQLLGVKYGFTLSEPAEEKLNKRCRWLARELKNPESQLGAMNGYLAVRESDSVIHAYYTRGGQSKTIEPEDITGEIYEDLTAEQVLAKLDHFIGMDSIKKDIRDLYNQMKSAAGSGKKPNMHAVLTGNPGTGKTTVVRTLGEIYSALGVLDTGHVVEADRGKLVAAYQGQTAIQVNKMVDTALGGILFVDEAYALKQGENDSFGQEAIDTLLKRVEDDRDKFCCIVAGYKTEMKNFMNTNPGLLSRFPKKFNLEDYNEKELLQIFLLNLKSEGYKISPEGEEAALAFFKDRVARKTKDFANGREARNLFEKARNRLAARLNQPGMQPSADELITLTGEDIPSNREEGSITVEAAIAKLDALTGLKSVKEKIRELTDTLEFNRMRGDMKPLAEHFLFTGNPGTGKTTVARIVADILFAIGMIPSRTLVEADRSSMVATHVGETARNVNDLIDKAMGGVLFVDEAYALKQGDGDSFGMEAINTLLKRMEDDRGKFICIAAGYSKEMADFLASNSGLNSRFTAKLEFEDYTAEELASIFRSMCKSEGYVLSEEADEAVLRLFQGVAARKAKDFGNARDARKIFEQTRARLSRRIIKLKQNGIGPEELQDKISRIEREDLPLAQDTDAKAQMEAALAELDEQIGLTSVKKKVRELMNVLDVQKLRGQEKPLEVHFVFTGNPGTGKTTIARILARIFHGIGLLPSSNLIETDRAGLVAGYQGQTAMKADSVIDRAMGGVLFVDEAYTLKQGSQDSFGQEAINTLLKRMEDDRGKFVVISAGYQREMEEFLNTNSGLRSRFSDTINFEDYNGEELTRIFELFAKKNSYQLGEGVAEKVRAYFDKIYAERDKNFGNARTARGYYNKVVENQSSRLVALRKNGVDDETLKKEANLIKCEDLSDGGIK